ncbi:MAG TPA: hypothetical protein GX708_15680 [Gallicola sp.]|nr:hypothetical protein [Gallicola sp.]
MRNLKLITKTTIVGYTMLVAIIFFGCNRSTETSNGDYVTKVIDSCEYIEVDSGIFDQRVYSLTHKGNCKFCTERSKK